VSNIKRALTVIISSEIVRLTDFSTRDMVVIARNWYLHCVRLEKYYKYINEIAQRIKCFRFSHTNKLIIILHLTATIWLKISYRSPKTAGHHGLIKNCEHQFAVFFSSRQHRIPKSFEHNKKIELFNYLDITWFDPNPVQYTFRATLKVFQNYCI